MEARSDAIVLDQSEARWILPTVRVRLQPLVILGVIMRRTSEKQNKRATLPSPLQSVIGNMSPNRLLLFSSRRGFDVMASTRLQ